MDDYDEEKKPLLIPNPDEITMMQWLLEHADTPERKQWLEENAV